MARELQDRLVPDFLSGLSPAVAAVAADSCLFSPQDLFVSLVAGSERSDQRRVHRKLRLPLSVRLLRQRHSCPQGICQVFQHAV